MGPKLLPHCRVRGLSASTTVMVCVCVMNLVPFKIKFLLKEVKYTFIIPIEKGWTTSKIWEMIYYGIIPFMHPYYDSQKNLKVPDFIRIKNSKDLLEKINFLEENENEYLKLRKSLLNLISDKDYSGENLINNIMNDFYNMIGLSWKNITIKKNNISSNNISNSNTIF